MDRLNQIRGEAGSSRDLTLDTTSPPSEAFMTANESSSKYFSLSEVDSTFSISPSKDSLATANTDPDRAITVDSELISNLSPIPKKSDLDSYKIGKQIEAANILSGGVDIFDDNDNSYDGDELVIDDNVILEDEKGNGLKLDGSELPIEKNMNLEPIMTEDQDIPSKDTEVVLQIDGKNVDAIDIGNGLYLYRKAGQEELAAVQIIDDDQQQPSFKFLKVRENTEGNLEVYEEIEIEIPKEVPIKEGKQAEKASHVPIKDISKVINEPSSNKIADKVSNTPKNETNINNDLESDVVEEIKTEVNLNGKMMKFNESRKSPLIGTYTPMTYHSTPNKEGIPLTKTMVDQHLHPSRHSDNVKKTIEVHTDRQKLMEATTKSNKDLNEIAKSSDKNCDHEKVINECEPLKSNNDENEITLSEHVIPDAITISEFRTPEKKKPVSENQQELDDSTDKMKLNNPDSVIEKENVNIKKITPLKQLQNPESLNEPLSNNAMCEIQITDKQDKMVLDGSEIEQNKTELNNKQKSSEISEDLTNNDSAADKVNVYDNNVPNQTTLQQESTCESKTKGILLEPIETIEGSKDYEKTNSDNTKTDCVETQIKNKIEANTQSNKHIKNSVGNSSSKLSTNLIEKLSEDIEKKSVEMKIYVGEKKLQSTSANNSTMNAENTNVLHKTNENRLTENAQISEFATVKPKTDVGDNFSKETVMEIKNVDIIKDNEKTIIKEENKKPNVVDNISQSDIILLAEEATPPLITNSYILDKQASDLTKIISKEQKNINTTSKIHESTNITNKKLEPKKEIPKPKVFPPKVINNNHSAVPFGKWTEANRQEFLNKIRETKVPSNNSNTQQLKQANDLNRRDVLKKIDSQRQSATGSTKISDLRNMTKVNTKAETAVFMNKSSTTKQEVKTTAVKPATFVKQKSLTKSSDKDESTANISTKKSPQRKEINNQDLIDKTIEGIINRAITGKSASENIEDKPVNQDANSIVISDSLDDIEKKMNELHGIPLEERSAHEMLQMIKNDPKNKTTSEIPKTEKSSKIPNLVPFKNKEQNVVKEKITEELSDDEVIEHEPVTGDTHVNKQNITALSNKDTLPNESAKEAIITEKDFDKFARRNSITYENCLTMSIDGKEPHNIIQTIVEKEVPVKKLSRNELMLAESRAKRASRQQILMRHNHLSNRNIAAAKTGNADDTYTKNYQSKVQIAYQSVISAKQNTESPVTIIEDKPVKVVYMDSTMEYTPMRSNIQGRELSPSKKQISDSPETIHSASESLDSDTLDTHNDVKSQDETKLKSKHQRKQVLTPVEEPELELIEPRDLGIDISPKKKRKLEDKNEKTKNLVPKKSYLLNRKVAEDEVVSKSQVLEKSTSVETKRNAESFKSHSDTISAIDNLVKAAELIETQAEKTNTTMNDSNQSLNNTLNTPVKRGRGRPRKYPLPDQALDVKAPSPQKKPRLIDAKVTKNYSDSDDSSDSEIVKENWTMGKINENIVCPICNKLFRSENVVFKHVKHCTGPSPNRSDSDQRSPIRLRRSSGRKSPDSLSDFTDGDEVQDRGRSRKSRRYSSHDQDDVIIIEDTPVKEKSPKQKSTDAKKNKEKAQPNTHNLICEFCGKTFRQLSYLVSHKIQHKKEDAKEAESEIVRTVFACEVCKKEFRKLHHLVQHRIIHNSNSTPSRQYRKSLSEQDTKSLKNQSDTKQRDDPSAGFRCEPCDKSFRKLHHLVEHRETHDGINKKGTSNVQNANDASKPSPTYHCDVCKKVFKKLQEFLEHKEQHLETSSEKSDDKSVKSSLSTKDIIHECSLCYMVFPNEHSLNKHTIICLRKKKQSAAKQAAKNTEEHETAEIENKSDENIVQNMVPNKDCEELEDNDIIIKPQMYADDTLHEEDANKIAPPKPSFDIDTNDLEKTKVSSEHKPKQRLLSNKESIEEQNGVNTNIKDVSEKPVKTENIPIKEYIIIPDTPAPKKKLPIKDRVAPTVTKRHKTVNVTLPVVDDVKPATESSDDDEVRYMLNPNFKDDDCSEAKLFMKVRAKKRNSLQIERPNSKDLIKRRISLQHPPKIPRLKVKAIEPKPVTSSAVEKRLKFTKPQQTSTDSDDSDVKYSFPVTDSAEVNASKDEKKSKKHSIGVKRKSLSGIAKRKSLGKHKLVTPTLKIKKRTTEVEHRCDCGQLFSSAALLARHTSLAHTPPRIRRRRSPPPAAPAPRDKPRKHKPVVPPTKLRGDVANTAPSVGVGTRKSSGTTSEAKAAGKAKAAASEPIGKVLRSAAHRGVPLPEKMRKLMEKTKK